MSGHRHQHDTPTQYSFDEIGIPYDFDEDSVNDLPVYETPSSSGSTGSKESFYDESRLQLDTDEDTRDEDTRDEYTRGEATGSTRSCPLRTRLRLEGRLQPPRQGDHHIWRSRDDSWIPSQKPAGPETYRVPASNLHKFLTRKTKKDLSANTDRLLNSLYKLKLRGRVDGRTFTPELQTQWITSPPSRCRSCDAKEFKIPSYHEHDKVNRQLCDILPKSPRLVLTGNSSPGRADKSVDTTAITVKVGGDSRWPNFQTSSDSENSFGVLSKEEKEHPLRIGNKGAKPSSQPKNEVLYRGRLDGRLHAPEEMEIQLTLTCTGETLNHPASPHQDLTFNDALELDQRLVPPCVNAVQNRGLASALGSSHLRTRTDGRLLALEQREAKWAVQDQASQDSREHSPRARIWRPCRIQEVFEKTLPHSVERSNDGSRPGTQKTSSDEFPSSYDPELEKGPSFETKPSELETRSGSDAIASSSGVSGVGTERSESESVQSSSESTALTISIDSSDIHTPKRVLKTKQSPNRIIYRV